MTLHGWQILVVWMSHRFLKPGQQSCDFKLLIKHKLATNLFPWTVRFILISEIEANK